MSGPYSDLTSDDYLSAAQRLLPQGPAWPRDTSSMLMKAVNAIVNVVWLVHQAVATLFERDLDPGQTVDLLPDWEDAFGLTARGTDDQRRANLLTVIADPGGFTAGHYVALGAALGITITAARTGAFAWAVHAPAALTSDDRKALEAIINLHNRITCTVTFIYDL